MDNQRFISDLEGFVVLRYDQLEPLFAIQGLSKVVYKLDPQIDVLCEKIKTLLFTPTTNNLHTSPATPTWTTLSIRDWVEDIAREKSGKDQSKNDLPSWWKDLPDEIIDLKVWAVVHGSYWLEVLSRVESWWINSDATLVSFDLEATASHVVLKMQGNLANAVLHRLDDEGLPGNFQSISFDASMAGFPPEGLNVELLMCHLLVRQSGGQFDISVKDADQVMLVVALPRTDWFRQPPIQDQVAIHELMPRVIYHVLKSIVQPLRQCTLTLKQVLIQELPKVEQATPIDEKDLSLKERMLNSPAEMDAQLVRLETWAASLPND